MTEAFLAFETVYGIGQAPSNYIFLCPYSPDTLNLPATQAAYNSYDFWYGQAPYLIYNHTARGQWSVDITLADITPLLSNNGPGSNSILVAMNALTVLSLPNNEVILSDIQATGSGLQKTTQSRTHSIALMRPPKLHVYFANKDGSVSSELIPRGLYGFISSAQPKILQAYPGGEPKVATITVSFLQASRKYGTTTSESILKETSGGDITNLVNRIAKGLKPR